MAEVLAEDIAVGSTVPAEFAYDWAVPEVADATGAAATMDGLQAAADNVTSAELDQLDAGWKDCRNTDLDILGHPEQDEFIAANPETGTADLSQQIENDYTSLSGEAPPGAPNTDTSYQVNWVASGNGIPSWDPDQVQVQTNADPIMMFCGQLVHTVQDFKIDGAGIDFVFKRIYKNHAFYNGPLGYKWNHNYNLWLRVTLGGAGTTIFRTTEDFREETYTKHPSYGELGYNY